MLGVPQAIGGTTDTVTMAPQKSGDGKRRETEKDYNKAGKDKNLKTTKKVKLHPTI